MGEEVRVAPEGGRGNQENLAANKEKEETIGKESKNQKED